MNSQWLSDNILQLMGRRDSFYSFDIFLLERVLGEDIGTGLSGKGADLDLRWKGYRELMRQLGDVHVAAAQTVQKWFGIHGRTVPGREHIFRLGFALGLSEAEVSEYLRKGIGEPDFQMNDYREVIFLYSLCHSMSYEEALGMIEEFEGQVPFDVAIVHHNCTGGLAEKYRIKCMLGRAEFLNWMLEQAEDFKGYSMTVLKYFQSYKREILHEVKRDAQEQLRELLKQTSFGAWAKDRRISARRQTKMVPKYLASVPQNGEEAVSDMLKNNILEMLQMSQISEDSNSELLAEMYADINHKYCNYNHNAKAGNKKQMPLDVNLMNDKYLSQLLKTGIHKEKLFRLTVLQGRLRNAAGKKCPQKAWRVLQEYGYPGNRLAGEEMLQWLEEKRRRLGRSCHMISRKDLLPLILCVAQKRYLKSMKDYHYREEDARNMFVGLANMTLAACRMEPFNPEKYEFDAVLSLCYQPTEMYFLSDVLDALAGQG